MLRTLILVAALTASSLGCVGVLGDTKGTSNDATTESDEGFPQSLLEPYTGTLHLTYDNTFITYDQLRGKVRIIFNDAWVRSGVDQFAENIGPLGGADFVTRFTEARAASADFLLSLDALSKDVCGAAATNGTGPFAGRDLDAALVDVPASTTVVLQAENGNDMESSSTTCAPGSGDTEYDLCTTGTLTSVTSPFPYSERFTIKVRARATGSTSKMEIRVGSTLVRTVSPVSNSATNYSVDVDATQGNEVSVTFPNDGNDGGVDRNLLVDSVTIVGPITPSTGNSRELAVQATIDAVYHKILFRSATADELGTAYALVKDVSAIAASQRSGWSGLCEALVRSPDFVFTLPPSRVTATGTDRDTLLLVKLAADLVARAPTAKEVDDIASQRVSIDEQIDTYLASTEFRDSMLHRMRLRTESNGTELRDEAARLWTYLYTSGKSYEDLLIGTYNVDTSFQAVPRPDYHGKSGVLSMKGYISGKPGLPHYNYAARVLGDFMGYVFQVPPDVVAMRLGATASSTVDPNSICYSCHQLLTPLAYQRRRWNDDGDYVAVTADGAPIDQTDAGLVDSYPYKGEGLEAFATQAVRKERFIHHTIDAEFDLLLRRMMRSDEDERVIYKQLYDALTTTGDLREPLKVLLKSPTYRGEL